MIPRRLLGILLLFESGRLAWDAEKILTAQTKSSWFPRPSVQGTDQISQENLGRFCKLTADAIIAERNTRSTA